MTDLRALLFGLLACLMTLTGIGAAAARGQMAAEGVICGSGTYAVVLAADGLPLFDTGGDPVAAQALPCLDCVLGPASLPSGAAPVETRLAAESDLHPLPPSVLTARLWRMGGKGRSPPETP